MEEGPKRASFQSEKNQWCRLDYVPGGIEKRVTSVILSSLDGFKGGEAIPESGEGQSGFAFARSTGGGGEPRPLRNRWVYG